MSSARLPPRNVHGAVRSRANTWWPDPSSKGWLPRPSPPWHVAQSWLAKSAFPRATLSGELGIEGGISMGLPGRENAVENDFTCCTTAASSSVESSPAKYGIALLGRPSRTVRTRSSSVGGSPAAVDLYLKIPDEKSRGRGNIDGAAGPFPVPSGPWQTAHRCANTLVPRGVSWSKCAPGGHVRSTYSAGFGRYSAVGTSSDTRPQMERPTSSASSIAPRASMTPNRERKSRSILGSFRAFELDCRTSDAHRPKLRFYTALRIPVDSSPTLQRRRVEDRRVEDRRAEDRRAEDVETSRPSHCRRLRVIANVTGERQTPEGPSVFMTANPTSMSHSGP